MATRRQDWSAAEESFGEALTLARDTGYRVEEGLILHEMGLMYARRGEAEQARECLKEALSLFQGIGAYGYVRRTEQVIESD